jgi:hypothetical protein
VVCHQKKMKDEGLIVEIANAHVADAKKVV